jgi:hypothetical protein
MRKIKLKTSIWMYLSILFYGSAAIAEHKVYTHVLLAMAAI